MHTVEKISNLLMGLKMFQINYFKAVENFSKYFNAVEKTF